ncbi:DUF6243 family protein [Streptomyces sp. NPDC001941]|uniref:DUF6243 family protein n=1 Tax=Streptomyces sp. NPDC001941 TaxID=3154659 RepID=UPI00332D71E6
MSKSRNNLLGVGGQRRKLSKADQQSGGPRHEDRQVANDHKSELLRKMRERAGGQSDDETGAADAEAGAEQQA